MNAEDSLKLARRFIELPAPKRRLFLAGLQEESVDFSLFPIPANVAASERDGLSYAQQRMAFLWQLAPQGAAYNLPMAVRLNGPLNRQALQRAFDQLVVRHESLRTRLQADGDSLRQEIRAPAAVMINGHDLSNSGPDEREARVASLAEAESQTPFDLLQGPLWRVQLVHLAADEHVLLLTLHHIVADGWSLNVLINEFVHLYDAACHQAEPALPPLPIQYRDYALWQRSWLEAGEQARQLAYWQAKLGDDHSPLELPLDYARPATPSHRGARHELHLPQALVERLGALAKAQGATLFMVLLASFKLLLQRYSGQRAIRVGVPVANRHRAEVEGLIGCFINTQVLHTDIDPFMDVAELLRRVKDTALGAQAHQDLPFERLVEALGLDRSNAHSPLFQVLFNHQAAIADAGQIRLASGLSLEKVPLQKHSARFDLALDTYESAGRLHAVFTYAQDLFAPQRVATMSQHWLALLEGLTADASGVIGELALPADGQPTQLPAVAEPDQQLCIHRLIETAANAWPERVAAVSGDDSITYAALHSRSDALAQALLDIGVRVDERVGVVADRSINMLVGLLAVLKAGAAYLPLEPDQPPARLAFILADSGVKRVLGRIDQAGLPLDVSCVDLGGDHRALPLRQVPVSAGNLAYVIYTSGTTGTPKGVAVSHGALVNYVQGVSQRLPMDQLQRMAMVTTPAADLGHTVLFGALCSGKTLYLLAKDQVLDADAFAAYMTRHEIDALKIVPSHVQAMLAAGASALPARCLILGGEACTQALLSRIAALAPALSVINHYGPTETTVGVLTHVLSHQPLLGRPLANSRAYGLDGCLHPVPSGARGELYIAGAGLARGYLGRAALTAERFVPDPSGAPGARMYRSGDWVRHTAEGELQFAGRMDGQVKIRGYRVELAEIDLCLRQQPGIDNVVVRRVGKESEAQLVAYLVPQAWPADEAARQALIDSIRASLKLTLPDPLVPHYLHLLERLPVTANGKVDLKALPEPVATVAQYRAPHTPLQVQVAAIWADVLQAGQVGLDDNFFALGGHSLLATQVVSRIRQQLELDVPLRALFDTRDLEAFTQVMAGLEYTDGGDIQPVDRGQPLVVSHAQYRQWMFWKLNPLSTAYNTPLAVRLKGELDHGALAAAFDELVARHESLRTVFEEREGVPHQRVLPAHPLPIVEHRLEAQPAQALAQHLEAQVSAPFDLANGPLIRVHVFRLGADEHVLSVLLHHIVSDGWSMSVMVRELVSAYNAAAGGQPLRRPALAVQYADYANWQRERLASGELQAQLAYWQATLENDFSVLELPADRLRPPVQSYRGGRVGVHLPAELTARLRRLAVQGNATLFHVFLASFALLLARYSGRDTLNIGVPVTNRNRLELEGLIGFFVNTLVARVAVDPLQSFTQLLASVKEITLQAQANKDIPFDVLVEALKPERGLGHNPLFQVMYNHLSAVGERVSNDSLQGVSVEEVDLPEHTSQFDITLNTLERSDGVMAVINYATDLFDAPRMQRMSEHWLNLLQAIVDHTEQPVAEFPLIGATEHQQIVVDWNRTAQPYPAEQCVHQLVEAQAARTPDAVALVHGEQELTYQQLNGRANQLARHLRELGVGPDVLVGVALERGLDLVVSLLAILKAGGAYVPLDPAYPQERLAYMLQDSQARVLLSHASLLEHLPQDTPAHLVLLDTLALQDSASDNLTPLSAPQNLAVSIYTSGSTGLPKGVLIEHRNIAALIGWAHTVYSQDDLKGVLACTSICFDLSVWELFVTLSAGGYAVIAQNALELPLLAAKDRVHLINTVPSAIKALHDAGQIPASVRIINLAGEPLKQALVDKLYGLGHVQHVHDLYGPSEDTTYSTCTRREAGGQANIGRPIANSAGYVLDGTGNPLPVGGAGEFCLAGAGLARGYLGRAALTAEKFLPNPFDTSAQGGGRLYRTGDLTRYRTDGVIEYVGRIDHQVKIRGFRIELGEIELTLLAHPSVREAVVVDIEGPGGRQLVAYLVTDGDVQGLRDHLKTTLPDYMVPAHLVSLDALPLTPNGKLDRKALPAPDMSVQQQAYVAPRTELEQTVAALWADVLQVERVGLTDNFFELGGHSLLATQATARLQAQLQIELPLLELFTASRLDAFVEAVARHQRDSDQDLDELSHWMDELETL
ncbi:amino acid adenylation domain-containing protein [Pseudomonas silvicola]|nr:amino acid adenylation domain-containing protein [Pseudomonas silvicola]